MPLLKTTLAALAFLAVPVLSPAALAEDADPALAGCSDAVGTFLTRRVNQTVSGVEHVGRSLLSLTNGGHAFFTDSAEGSVSGFQPFSDGRGVWRCVSGDAGTMRFTALILDFTFPIAGLPDRASFCPTDAVAGGRAFRACAHFRIAEPPHIGYPADCRCAHAHPGTRSSAG